MNNSSYIASDEKIASVFDLLRQPARIQILIVIRLQPACVCHLEAALGLRQASISQHLMALRAAGLVSTQREGRNIFYLLAEPRIFTLIEQAAAIHGIPMAELERLSTRPIPDCSCPQCSPNLPPELSCKSLPKHRKS